MIVSSYILLAKEIVEAIAPTRKDGLTLTDRHSQINHSLPIKDPLRPDILLLFAPFEADVCCTIELNPLVSDYYEAVIKTE